MIASMLKGKQLHSLVWHVQAPRGINHAWRAPQCNALHTAPRFRENGCSWLSHAPELWDNIPGSSANSSRPVQQLIAHPDSIMLPIVCSLCPLECLSSSAMLPSWQQRLRSCLGSDQVSCTSTSNALGRPFSSRRTPSTNGQLLHTLGQPNKVSPLHIAAAQARSALLELIQVQGRDCLSIA